MKMLNGLKVLTGLIVLIGVMLFVQLIQFYKDSGEREKYQGSNAIVLTQMPSEIDEKMVEIEIIKRNSEKSAKAQGEVDTASFEFLGAQKIGDNAIRVFVVGMFNRYNHKGNVASSCNAVVITFVNANGEYKCNEYFEPSDGENYSDDIVKNFPPEICENVLNKSKYVSELSQMNRLKADDELKKLDNVKKD